MLKRFRKKEINVILSEWGKNPHSETLGSLKCQAQGIALYSIDNGNLFEDMRALSKHLVG